MAPRFLMSLLCCAAATSVVAAEPAPPSEPVPAKLPTAVSYRMFGAYSSRIGCSPYILSCEGLDRYRQGFTASSGSLNDAGGTGVVVTYQAWARQTSDAVLDAQVIATVGVRKRIGRGWVQGAAGIANAAVRPGPKAISAQQAATTDGARAAVALGTGIDVGTKARPLSISVDVGSSLEAGDDDRIYQAAATVIKKF